MARSEIRNELKKRGFDGFADEDLNRYINWGLFYLARKLRMTGVEEDIAFSLDVGEYRQPLDTLSPTPKSIRHVVVTDTDHETRLPPMTPGEFWNNWAPFGFVMPNSTIISSKVGEPTNYFVHGGAIIIMPAVSTPREFALTAWNHVTALNDDGAIYALPENQEEMLLSSVMKVCHIRANEVSRGDALKTEIVQQLDDALSEEAFVGEELQDRVDPDDAWW